MAEVADGWLVATAISFESMDMGSLEKLKKRVDTRKPTTYNLQSYP
jgi:hypothetical protein